MQQEGPIAPKTSSALPYWSQRIFAHRSARGWSQEELAEKIEADAKSVSRWEHAIAFPKPFYRQKLVEVFQTTHEEMGFLRELLQRNQRQGDLDDSPDEEVAHEFDRPDAAPINETFIEETITISDQSLDPARMSGMSHDTGSTQKHDWWNKPIIIMCVLLLIGASAAGLLYTQVIRHYQHIQQPTPAKLQFVQPPEKGLLYYLYPLGPDIRANAVAWSPDGRYLASANGDGTAWVIDTIENRLWIDYTHHSKFVNAIAWAPDKSMRVASASGDGTVQIWNGAIGNRILTYRGDSTSVWAVAWSPNGQFIASGGLDATVQVWNASTGAQLLTYSGHTKSVEAIAWSPDGSQIASAGDDGTVQVWNSTTGAHIYTYRGHMGAVFDLSWSPDGQHIASASADGTVQVWNVINGGDVLTYRGHWPSSVQAVKWSPNGKYIASGGTDKIVQVWSATTGHEIMFYLGHLSGIYGLAWAPDGKYIASASSDGTIRIWDAPKE